jgi:hypothetical protein
MWHTPVIAALKRQREEMLKIKASLGYITRLWLKKKIKPNHNIPLPKKVKPKAKE